SAPRTRFGSGARSVLETTPAAPLFSASFATASSTLPDTRKKGISGCSERAIDSGRAPRIEARHVRIRHDEIRRARQRIPEFGLGGDALAVAVEARAPQRAASQ